MPSATSVAHPSPHSTAGSRLGKGTRERVRAFCKYIVVRETHANDAKDERLRSKLGRNNPRCYSLDAETVLCVEGSAATESVSMMSA